MLINLFTEGTVVSKRVITCGLAANHGFVTFGLLNNFLAQRNGSRSTHRLKNGQRQLHRQRADFPEIEYRFTNLAL
ncbi:MAG: hypothetical protein HON77_21580 [Gammaproteobacteria bacterium]|nr:hypothetical protein [Gammaproteobacteria bacterium]